MVSPSSGTGTAHAKAILLGEHAVVYGAPAIALPVPALTVRAHADRTAPAPGGGRLACDLYEGTMAQAPERVASTLAAVRAALDAASPGIGPDDVDVRVTSTIPAGRGLGSSAAVAAAVADAVASAAGVRLDHARRRDIVMESERVAHGTPSGLDAHAVVANAPIWFHDGQSEELPAPTSGALVVADTGAAVATRDAVAGLRALRERRPHAVDSSIARLADLTASARTDLLTNDLGAVGAALDEAHHVLASLGVSNLVLDHVATEARRAGALGAKLTGGGRGGCVIALADDGEAAAELAERLRAAGAHTTWTLDLARTATERSAP